MQQKLWKIEKNEDGEGALIYKGWGASSQISRDAFNEALPRAALTPSRAAQASYRYDCVPFGEATRGTSGAFPEDY
ncbi:hypothetical protein AAC387_Pa02g0651 [Persea americana]